MPHDHEHHHHDHGDNHHGHTHGAIDPSIVSHERGLWAVKWSFVALMGTALLQLVVVIASNSIALLADTIHNFGDAATAIPLGIAFMFARLKPSKKFTYGYGRVEDLAGVLVVLLILLSAIVAGYESIRRLIHPEAVGHLGVVVLAAVVSFVGNEGVAIFRIKVGKEIGSAALIADGYHARVDGWASLAVLAGAVGIWLGFPLADPIIGLLITLSILWVVWDSARMVFTRMLDGIEPDILHEIHHAAEHVKGVREIGEVRARWIGHKLYADINISVRSDASVSEGHEIAKEVNHQLVHHLPQLGQATIHVDPDGKLGEEHHRHTHDDCHKHLGRMPTK